MQLADVESKTGQTTFAPRTVEPSDAGEEFRKGGHCAKF